MVSLKVIKDFNIPKAIFIYDEGARNLDFKKIKEFIRDNFANKKVHLIKLKKEIVRTKGLLYDFLATEQSFDEIKHSFSKVNPAPRAKARGFGEKYPDTALHPRSKERDFTGGGLKSTFVKDFTDSCHIIISEKLFATLDEHRRPHIRASIYGSPSVISTSGIVEGPAKPREFYIYKQKYSQLGTWAIEEEKVKQRFKGRFIDYRDSRLTEVIKGYIAQAIFFYITGEPFCKNKNCRLFNAHWQQDLIYAQITKGIFCLDHKNTIDKIKKVKG